MRQENFHSGGTSRWSCAQGISKNKQRLAKLRGGDSDLQRRFKRTDALEIKRNYASRSQASEYNAVKAKTCHS